jgi:hypothetical protein
MLRLAPGSEKGGVGFLAIWFAELACSAVADTLTLPVLLYLREPSLPCEGGEPAQYSCGAVPVRQEEPQTPVER